MNTTGLLAAGVAASLSMATVPRAAAQERSLDEIKKESCAVPSISTRSRGFAVRMPRRSLLRLTL
jgi:hypothetical protein